MKPNRHGVNDLKYLQALPLKTKIDMTKDRVKVWYESWTIFEIQNLKTGLSRFITWDTRKWYEPPIKKDEWIKNAIPGAVYLSFSGGIDSTVLKHIIDSMYDDVPSVFSNTGLEYPEIQKFVRDVKSGKWDCFNSDVVIIRPDMRFDDVIKTFGYPLVSKTISKKVGIVSRNGKECETYQFFLGNKKKSNGDPSEFNCEKWEFLCDAPFKTDYYCCEIMKKRPFREYEKQTRRKPISAVMASESKTREAAWRRTGCNAFDATHQISNPMSFWTRQDVLQYIGEYSVPYCPVYGEIQEVSTDRDGESVLETTGCDRTGCIFCGYGCHLESTPNRFQKLKETHPRQYEYCIGGGEMIDGQWIPNKSGLGMGYVLDYIGVKYD